MIKIEYNKHASDWDCKSLTVVTRGDLRDFFSGGWSDVLSFFGDLDDFSDFGDLLLLLSEIFHVSKLWTPKVSVSSETFES